MAEFNITTSSNMINADVIMSSNENINISPNMMTEPSNQTIIISSPSNNLKKDSEENDGTIITSATNLLQTNVHKLLQNKLKRKKKITSSLISVNGNDERHTINEKKRTKMEKNLSSQKNQQGNKENYDKLKLNNIQSINGDSSNVVVTKPPLPPKTNEKLYNNNNNNNGKIPPPRQKRKMEENSTIIQKLNAQSDQLRLEISELKNALSTERNAVRTLRAQYESDNRKSKNEIKKLQTALEGMKKLATTNQQQKLKTNIKDDINSIVKDNSNIELNKLNQEITVLKDVNRILEEKIRICNDGDRRKSLYVQELTDSYETRLTQISKSAKIEINRLLEEIKTKERNIGQLKKEINSNKNNSTNNQIKNKDIRIVQHPTEMKKLKDIETTLTNNKNCVNNDTNNNKEILNNIKKITKCNENEFNSEQHEINERILEAHQNLLICRTKDNMMNSDTDSALSSAPQSISPQPPNSGEQDQTDIWLTVRNYTKELESLKSENHLIQKENDLLKNELQLAKQQIKEFEKTAFEANNNNIKLQQLKDRINYLEEKERDLMKESHELREQNELMEFRILELEESHDKWSIRSNSTPDTKEMWTDTEKEHDDILIFTDRSDSGVTSPHSQNNIDDRNIISPCDLSLLDPMSNDELKRRITLLSKKSNIDEDDKICLIQIIHLINNLDALSNDSIMNCNSDDSISLEFIKSKFYDYIQSSSTPTSRLILQTSDKLINNNNNNKNSRIVATVLPYSSNLSTPTESPSRSKYRSWTSSSLQESGIFDTDNIISSSTILDSYYCQSTQTEPEDFPCQINNHNNNNNNNCNNPSTTKDLCAEIQKLNKFREQIEECVTKSPINTTTSSTTILNNNNNNNKKIIPIVQLSPNLSEQKRLQYYKERLDILENKLLIYESSGDVQIKLLSDRLQNEIILKKFVKDLNEKVDKLIIINQQLEEEKCEFEEAENDTRLRLQRLEIDLEILNQRNIELEMSRDLLQNKLKEIKNHNYNLQNDIIINDKKLTNLIDNNNELTNRLQLIKMSMPAILLFNTFMVHGSNQNVLQQSSSHINNENQQQQIDENYVYGFDNENNQKDNINKSNEYIKMKDCKCNTSNQCKKSTEIPQEQEQQQQQQQLNEFINIMPKFDNIEQKSPTLLEQQLYQLQSRERELNMNIAELNRAYQETMENADCLWAQIEKDYKDKLSIAECNEQFMRTKINQLEDRLRNDCQIAQERIQQLEETETEYKHCYCKIQKEYRDLLNEHNILNEEYQNIKDEFIKLKKYCDGPGRQSLDLEKGRCKHLQDELELTQRLLNEADENYKNDLEKCTIQGNKIRKDLLQIQVTNSELQEEVLTLEKQIAEFNINTRQYDDKLRTLLDEIRNKDDIIINLECRLNCLDNNRNDICTCSVQSLEEELNYGKRTNASNMYNNNNNNNNNGCKRFKIDDIRDLRTASVALGQVLDCVMECEKCKPDTKEIQDMASEVKGLADRILGMDPTTDESEVGPSTINNKNKPNNNDDNDNNKNNNNNNDDNDGDDDDDDNKPNNNNQLIQNIEISNNNSDNDNNNNKDNENEEEFQDIIDTDIEDNDQNNQNNQNNNDDDEKNKKTNDIIMNYAFIQTPTINFEYIPNLNNSFLFKNFNNNKSNHSYKNLIKSISTPTINIIAEVPSIVRKLTESKKDCFIRNNNLLKIPSFNKNNIQINSKQYNNILTQTDNDDDNIQINDLNDINHQVNDSNNIQINDLNNQQINSIIIAESSNNETDNKNIYNNEFAETNKLIETIDNLKDYLKNLNNSPSLISIENYYSDETYLNYDQYENLTDEIANINNKKLIINNEIISKQYDNDDDDDDEKIVSSSQINLLNNENTMIISPRDDIVSDILTKINIIYAKTSIEYHKNKNNSDINENSINEIIDDNNGIELLNDKSIVEIKSIKLNDDNQNNNNNNNILPNINVKSLEDFTNILNNIADKELTELTNNHTMKQLTKILEKTNLETVTEITEYSQNITSDKSHICDIELLNDASVSKLSNHNINNKNLDIQKQSKESITLRNLLTDLKNINIDNNNNNTNDDDDDNNNDNLIKLTDFSSSSMDSLKILSTLRSKCNSPTDSSNQFYRNGNNNIIDILDSSQYDYSNDNNNNNNNLININNNNNNNNEDIKNLDKDNKILTKTSTFFMEIKNINNNVNNKSTITTNTVANPTTTTNNNNNDNDSIDDDEDDKLNFINTKNYKNFIKLLIDSIIIDTNDSLLLNKSIQELKLLLNIDNEFCNNFELLLILSNQMKKSKLYYKKYNNLNIYDKISISMKCLKIIKNIFNNLKIPILKIIEDELIKQLLEYHCKSLNSKFLCSVYSLIPRNSK